MTIIWNRIKDGYLNDDPPRYTYQDLKEKYSEDDLILHIIDELRDWRYLAHDLYYGKIATNKENK